MQLVPLVVTAELFTCTLILTPGLCLSVKDFVLDIEENLRQLNAIIASNENKVLKIRQQIEIKAKIFDIINFHSEAMQLSKKLKLNKIFEEKKNLKQITFRFTNRISDTNSPSMLTYLLFFVVSFSSVPLQINIVT